MTNTILGIIIVAVIVIVGWLAYTQGYFQGSEENDADGIEIRLDGSSDQ